MRNAGGVKNINIKNIAMKQPEFTIEQIRDFVKKGHQSVSARYVKAAMDYIERLNLPINDSSPDLCCGIYAEPKKFEDFPDIDFRKDIAEELSRGELIERLCEMNTQYRLIRQELFNAELKNMPILGKIAAAQSPQAEMRELKLHDQIEFENGEQYEIMSIFTGGRYDIKLLKPDPQYYWLPDQRPIYYSIKLEKYKMLKDSCK